MRNFLYFLGLSVLLSSSACLKAQCSPQQLSFLKGRGYSPDQQASLCGAGFEFIKDAATLTIRGDLRTEVVGQVLNIPEGLLSLQHFDQPVNATFVICAPTQNAIRVLGLLFPSTATQSVSPSECNDSPSTLLSHHAEAVVAARAQASWAPWKLQLSLTDGAIRGQDSSSTPIAGRTLTSISTDQVTVDLPDSSIIYRMAIFFTSDGVTLALAPDNAKNLSMPDASAVVPLNELIPNGIKLNTSIRIPASIIDGVATASSSLRIKVPTNDPNIGDLTLSNFRWPQTSTFPAPSAKITASWGDAFSASLSLSDKVGSWMAMDSVTFHAIERPCSGDLLAQAQCRAKNQLLNRLAPIAAQIVTAHYRHTPLIPFSTTRKFPLTIGNKTIVFQSFLYSLLPYQQSADLVMHCQVAIGDIP